MPRLAVIGAGPKGIAIAAKARACRGRPEAPQVVLVDRSASTGTLRPARRQWSAYLREVAERADAEIVSGEVVGMLAIVSAERVADQELVDLPMHPRPSAETVGPLDPNLLRHDDHAGAIADRLHHRVRVLGEAGSVIAGRQVGRENFMAA